MDIQFSGLVDFSPLLHAPAPRAATAQKPALAKPPASTQNEMLSAQQNILGPLEEENMNFGFVSDVGQNVNIMA